MSKNSKLGQLVLLAETEMQILEELNREGRVACVMIYIFALRKKMDFKTGYVGFDHRLSYKTLDEVTECLPNLGSHKVKSKRSVPQLRNDLKILVECGLITPVIDKGKALPLVFFLPEAPRASFRPDELHHHDDHPESEKKPIKTDVSGFRAVDVHREEHHTKYILKKQKGENHEFLKKVVDLYHAVFPESPKIRLISGEDLNTRFDDLLARDQNYHNYEFWQHYFVNLVKKNDFLMGRSFEVGHKPFVLNFMGLIEPSIVERVCNGAFR